jgi:hypothetical protein
MPDRIVRFPMGSAERRGSADDGPSTQFPAFGPVDAVLSYALFFGIVDRVTPVVLEVVTETVLDLSASLVGLFLAALLWFVLAVTIIEQVRRQLAALGVIDSSPEEFRVWARLPAGRLQTGGYLLGFGFGAIIAWVTFEGAIEAIVSVIPAVATVDPSGVAVSKLFEMVVFFVAFSAGAHSLDRLVIGWVQTLLSE